MKGANFDYIVDKDKRKVVAIMTLPTDCVMEELLNVVAKGTATHLVFGNVSFQGNMNLKEKYTGIATCNPKDTFDTNRGMEVARMKAIRAYLRDRKIITQRLTMIFDDVNERVNMMDKHTDYAIDHINDYLKNA